MVDQRPLAVHHVVNLACPEYDARMLNVHPLPLFSIDVPVSM